MRIQSIVGLVAFCALLPGFGLAAAPAVGTLLEQSVVAYGAVEDYSCRLARKENLDGRLKEHTTVVFKYKRPGRYYMKWPSDWIELIYAEGRYDNKMVIHGGKFFKFASIRVKPERALDFNRHTIKEAGFGYTLELVQKNFRQAQENQDASLLEPVAATVDGRPTWRLQGVFPAGKGYYAHRVYLDIDQANLLPVKIEAYGWQDEFLEMYTYTDIKLNIGLSEQDFDIHNKAYRFGKEKE